MIKTTFLRLLRPGLCIVAAGLVLSTVPACTVAAELVYEPVAGDVSYSAVESLRFREADEHIAYGDDALQFGLLWLPSASSGTSPVHPRLPHRRQWSC